MNAVIKYHCPICKRAYDSPEEAEACYQSPRGRFFVGDILVIPSTAYAYRIEYLDPPDSQVMDGASMVVSEHYRKARNIHPTSSGFFVGSCWCRAKLFPLKEAQELVTELRRRLKHAERFLAEVEATHARHQDRREAAAAND